MNTRKNLYRNAENGKIAGVCSGLADYFGIETWLVRILTVTAFFLLAGTFVFVSYIAAWFILDKKPKGEFVDNSATFSIHSGKGWRNGHSQSDTPVSLKTKVWQAGTPPKQVLNELRSKFVQSELKLRDMEKYVTSREFQLKREFSRL